MPWWNWNEDDSTSPRRTAGDAKSNARSNLSTGLKNPGSATVEALPYPAKRPSQVQEVQEWAELPSSPSGSDSSQYFDTEIGMRSSTATKMKKPSAAGSTLSVPLLRWGDSECNVIHEDNIALDNSSRHSNGSLEPSEEKEELPHPLPKGVAGSSSRSLGNRAGLHSLASSRMRQSSMTSDVKVAQIFKRPLASEGEGSVFPIALPIAKRRAYEVKFIQRFDRLTINANGGEFWTIIDASWIKDWIEFVMGNRPSPGPISNYQLYDQKIFLSDERRKSLLVKHAVSATAVSGVLASHPDLSIKEGLQRVKDYRVIHPLVWFIFREVYDTDGSPDIFRWKSDVYSDEVTGVRKGKMVEEVHTKAVYELRRFSSRLKDGVEATT